MEGFVIPTELLTGMFSILLQILILVIIFVGKKYVIPFLEVVNKTALEKLGSEKYMLVRAFVIEMVHYVEDKYSMSIEKMGEVKQAEVVAFIRKKFPDFDEEMLDAIIKNVVAEMKQMGQGADGSQG